MGKRRLGQDEQYLTVREILAEASRVADGALSRERSGFLPVWVCSIKVNQNHSKIHHVGIGGASNQ